VSDVALDDPSIAPEPGGIDRRSMIKRAAAAGALAWTAPMIIDSLSSPAAASSTDLPTGVYIYVFRLTYLPGACTAVLQSAASCPVVETQCSPGHTRIEPGALGEFLVTGHMECGSGPVFQGACWTTSAGTISGYNFAQNNCGSAFTFGCLSGAVCPAGSPVPGAVMVPSVTSPGSPAPGPAPNNVWTVIIQLTIP
jgi:hypothetical protein